MITLKNPYDSTQLSKWLFSKPTEITLISQWAHTGNIPHMHPTGTYEAYVILFVTGTYPNI